MNLERISTACYPQPPSPPICANGVFQVCCVALCCVVLRFASLRCAALRCVALCCVALRCVALLCFALRCGTERDGTARCGNGAEAMLAGKAIMALLARKVKLAFPPLKQLGPQPLPPLGRGGHMLYNADMVGSYIT